MGRVSLFLHVATGVNSAGQIVGGPQIDEPYTPVTSRAFLLTSVPSCDLAGDVNQDDLVNGADIAGYVRAKPESVAGHR